MKSFIITVVLLSILVTAIYLARNKYVEPQKTGQIHETTPVSSPIPADSSFTQLFTYRDGTFTFKYQATSTVTLLEDHLKDGGDWISWSLDASGFLGGINLWVWGASHNTSLSDETCLNGATVVKHLELAGNRNVEICKVPNELDPSRIEFYAAVPIDDTTLTSHGRYIFFDAEGPSGAVYEADRERFLEQVLSTLRFR